MDTRIGEIFVTDKLDNAIASSIQEQFYNYDPLRVSGSSVDVEVRGGEVVLTGNVRTRAMRSIAEKIARATHGVRSVKNKLLSDTEIEERAAVRLAMDPRTQLMTDQVKLHTYIGMVGLVGTVGSAEIKEAVGQMLLDIPGVRDVVNDLKVDTSLLRKGDDVNAGQTGAVEAAEAETATPKGPRRIDGRPVSPKGKVSTPLSAERRAMLSK
ncbi:MAG: BON domain-containing protein [Chloroflexi bacterium]|nr:BON domain-containing protein [Chloroflexota bacterium]